MGDVYKQSAYPKYNRVKKKFPPVMIKKLGMVEDQVALHPMIGEEETGELNGIWVYKFKMFDLLVLLAYEVDRKNKEVIFVAVGGHENFYRELKNYLK